MLRLLRLARSPGVERDDRRRAADACPTPGRRELFSEPAVWQGKWVFVSRRLAAPRRWRLSGGRLHEGVVERERRHAPGRRRRAALRRGERRDRTSTRPTIGQARRDAPARATSTGRARSSSTAGSPPPRATRTTTRRAACSTSTRSRSAACAGSLPRCSALRRRKWWAAALVVLAVARPPGRRQWGRAGAAPRPRRERHRPGLRDGARGPAGKLYVVEQAGRIVVADEREGLLDVLDIRRW